MKSGKYFDGTLADDDTSLCFVGFNTLKQQEMATNKDANVAITLNNCMIQKAKFGTVVVTNSTKVTMSPRKFANPAVLVIPTSQITLDFVQTLQNYQHVSVKVKVANVDPKVQVKPGYKLNLDSTNKTLCRVTLWQEHWKKTLRINSIILSSILLLMSSTFPHRSPTLLVTFTPLQTLVL